MVRLQQGVSIAVLLQSLTGQHREAVVHTLGVVAVENHLQSEAKVH